MYHYGDVHTGDQRLRVAVFILYTVFAFCWTFFFQGVLMGRMYDTFIAMIGGIEGHYSRFVTALILTVFMDVIAMAIRMLPFVKGPFYSLDFLIPSIILGTFTSFDGEHFFSQSAHQWTVVLAVSMFLFALSAFIKARFVTRLYNGPARTAINLMILPVAFFMTVSLGNTDEMYHRELLVTEYINCGNYEKALLIGKNEEETSTRLDILRTNAMLLADSGGTGLELGNRLFEYHIYDPVYLSAYIRNKAITDSLCHDNAMIVAALLDRDLVRADSTVNVETYNKVVPKFIMQAMVIAGNERVKQAFPEQFGMESENYNSFLKVLEESENSPTKFLKNKTLPDWRNTYFWYYRFK